MKAFAAIRNTLRQHPIALLTVVSTLLLMVDSYHTLTASKLLDRTLLFLVAPLAFILLSGGHPRDYGLQLGRWRTGLLLTAGAILLITPVLWLLLRADPTMRAYYAPAYAGLPWSTFWDLLGWEFLFRGWLLFGYAQRFGADALWLQAVPFALAHIGKPESETLSTIFGGFAFGWIAWRSQSFLYPFLIHWYVASVTVLLAAQQI